MLFLYSFSTSIHGTVLPQDSDFYLHDSKFLIYESDNHLHLVTEPVSSYVLVTLSNTSVLDPTQSKQDFKAPACCHASDRANL